MNMAFVMLAAAGLAGGDFGDAWGRGTGTTYPPSPEHPFPFGCAYYDSVCDCGCRHGLSRLLHLGSCPAVNWHPPYGGAAGNAPEAPSTVMAPLAPKAETLPMPKDMPGQAAPSPAPK